MNGKAYKIKEKLSDTLELPRDIILDIPKLIVIGTDNAIIENHKGIIDYCDNKISINTGSGILIITGTNLLIKSIVQEEIEIKGKIKSINF